MLVGRRISAFQPQAGGLGQPVEERGLRRVVDDLGDFVVGIMLAQARNVGVGDQRRVDGDLASDREHRAFRLKDRLGGMVDRVFVDA